MSNSGSLVSTDPKTREWLDFASLMESQGLTLSEVKRKIYAQPKKQNGGSQEQEENPYVKRVRQMWEAKQEIKMMKALDADDDLNVAPRRNDLDDIRDQLQEFKNRGKDSLSLTDIIALKTLDKDNSLSLKELLPIMQGNSLKLSDVMDLIDRTKQDAPAQSEPDLINEKARELVIRTLNDALDPSKKIVNSNGQLDLNGIQSIIEKGIDVIKDKWPSPQAPPKEHTVETFDAIAEPVTQ